MRNLHFLKEDRLGIHQHFYEIMMLRAGCIPVDIISRARSNYTGYSFQITDLRDKLHSSGTRDRVADSTVQRPTLLPIIVSLERQSLLQRRLISGTTSPGKLPPKLQLFTNPRPLDILYIRKVSKELVERNSKYNISKKIRKIKKSALHYMWENYAPPEGYVPPSKRIPA